jgi:hypothetical protein
MRVQTKKPNKTGCDYWKEEVENFSVREWIEFLFKEKNRKPREVLAILVGHLAEKDRDLLEKLLELDYSAEITED